jgi:hypothetical protein
MKRVSGILRENGIKVEGELKETILDLEFYEKNGKLRRESVWQS